MKEFKNARPLSRSRTVLGTMAVCLGLPSPGAFGASCEAPGAPADAPRLETVVSLGLEREDALSWEVSWPARGPRPLAAVDTPAVGGLVRILRCLPPGRWAVVGQGRVERINGALAEATVSVDAQSADDSPHGHVHPQLPLRGNLFPRPMVGDVVVPVLSEVRARPRVNPRIEIDAGTLFDGSGEALSEGGRERLAQAIRGFASASGRLLVEAHIRTAGDRRALRRVSQLRADAVAQFAMRELGVEPDRVVPVGFGSDGFTGGFVEVPAWPARAPLESVVLRVLPAPAAVRESQRP